MKRKGFGIRDFFIPIALLGIIGSIVVPLPHFLIDLLIIGNLIISIALLVSALQVADPLRLSALPSILLLTTLYRLCVNISTTRSILGTGNAGMTVEAFGKFVIGGSLGVGVVVFLVLTLVQFIVIAKGSERVAEVAARFTLDALPGKQMSIDADVRAGLYDLSTARSKREELQMESRYYGALDGAMKFVKGDAIAGLCIVVVNIIGGLVSGIVVESLPISLALQKYTILTIGDGLSSQIPSLLSSLAAGLVVTRVNRSESSSSELLGQLFQKKSVFFIVGGFLTLLAFVPLMPTFVLLGVGASVLTFGIRHTAEENEEAPPPAQFFPKVPPLLSITKGAGWDYLDVRFLDHLRSVFFERTGLLLPAVNLAFQSSSQDSVRLEFRGVQILSCTEKDPELLESRLQETFFLIRTELLDDGQTRRLLDFHDPLCPELTAQIVPQHLSITQLTELLRDLVREGVNIRTLDVILQAIAEATLKGASGRLLLEEVRALCGRVIIYSLFGNIDALNVWVPSFECEEAFSKAEREKLNLDLDQINHFVAEVRQVEAQGIITTRAARKLMAECLEIHGFSTPVLAHEEIPKNIRINPIRKRNEINRELYAEKLAA